MDNYSLFELEKDYYLGNYQSCINKANSMVADKAATFYLCLSYFHLKKYDNLEHEIAKNKGNQSIDLVGMLLTYTRSSEKRDQIVSKLDSILEDKSVESKDELSRLIMSSIYVHHKVYSNALRALSPLDTLPAMLARAGVYLSMNRVDLAEKQLKSMQNKDDFATLTLLAVAQVRLASGSAREAQDIAKELEEKYRATPLLYNLQSAAAISMDQYDMAKQHCENALDLDNDNLEAMINMVHILSKLKASAEIRDRHYSRMKALYPKHELVEEVEKIKLELCY